MKKKIRYTDEPMGRLKRIADFLPAPDALIPKEENVRVTLELSKTSILFFKQQAKKHHTQYQKMLRKVIDLYARQFGGGNA